MPPPAVIVRAVELDGSAAWRDADHDRLFAIPLIRVASAFKAPIGGRAALRAGVDLFRHGTIPSPSPIVAPRPAT
jgi:hypothetical protein